MENKREIMHKVLDGDASDHERKLIAHGMECDPEVREEFLGLVNAVRLLEESERHEAPPGFTAAVMQRLPRTKRPAFGRVRDVLFSRRVLQWNIASALAAAVILLVAVVIVSQVRREPAMTASGPTERAVTVRLTFYSPQAKSVSVAGDFNKWKTDADSMKNADGMWSINLELEPGVYSYSFVVDGKSWVPDPGAQAYEDDGFGSRNAVLRVSI